MAPKYDLCGVHFQLDEIVRTLVVIFQDLNFYTKQGIQDKYENLALDISAEELNIEFLFERILAEGMKENCFN